MPYALEKIGPHQQRVSPGDTFSFRFGPATPGPLDVYLSATKVREIPFRIEDDRVDPGDSQDPEPVEPISPTAFRVEVFDARGRSIGSGNGRTSLDVPSQPLPGDGGLAPGTPLNTWRVQVTNNSAFEAGVVVHVRFYGVRPIESKPFELNFINDRFDALFNSVQPLRLRFENRELWPGLPWTKTWFVVDADESWQLPRDLELDLGGEVVSRELHTITGGITVRACVHDGCPAIRMRVDFAPVRGDSTRIDLINLVGVWKDELRDLLDAAADYTWWNRPTFVIERLAIDVYFVLRPGPDRQATFQVIAQPTVEADDSPTKIVIARMIAQAVFEIGLPRLLGDRLDAFAKTFAAWLLGDRNRELAGGVEKLDIQYVGDAPRPQVVGPTTTTVSPTSVPIDPGNLMKIDHIVVVMMENRSFDNMLGYLRLPTRRSRGDRDDIVGRGRPDVDGLKGDESNPSGVLGGGLRRIFPLSRAWEGDLPRKELRTRPTRFVPDPGHSYERTLAQRWDEHHKNKGFVIDFANRLVSQTNPYEIGMVRRVAGEVMGYHPAKHVPTYDHFAQYYAICDHWFASHPGHTWPNRFVSLTGELARGPDGFPQVDNPDGDTYDPLETLTIVDHLLNAGVSCSYFEHDFCMLRTFSSHTFDERDVIVPINAPGRGFFALASAGNLPAVSFVEPDLTNIDVGNDDHPPADVTDGQRFLRRVYDALAGGPQWEKTLLLITYDEHGGFFDHVYPEKQKAFDPATFDPAAYDPANPPDPPEFVPIALDPRLLDDPVPQYQPILHYGMRVPAFVVSPWVNPGDVSHVTFDHTSIPKTIIARFLANNPPDMGWRVALANHVGPLLSRRGGPLPQPPPAPVDPPLASPRVLLRRPDRPTIAGTEDQDFRDFLRGFRDRVRA